MFTKSEIKENLLGCFEIAIFMRRGVVRFRDTKVTAVKSLVIPLVLTPIVVILMVMVSQDFATEVLIPLHVGRIILTMMITWAIVYLLSKHFNRDQYFWRFVTISCWVDIIGFLLLLPIVIGVMTGYEFSVFESYALFSGIVGYVYAAFIATHVLKLPWELGGFVAIVSMGVSENMIDFTVYLRDSFAYSV